MPKFRAGSSVTYVALIAVEELFVLSNTLCTGCPDADGVALAVMLCEADDDAVTLAVSEGVRVDDKEVEASCDTVCEADCVCVCVGVGLQAVFTAVSQAPP
jgi:hypothetical protein